MEIRPAIPPQGLKIAAKTLQQQAAGLGIPLSPYLIRRLTPKPEDFTFTKTPAGDQFKLSPESSRRFKNEIFHARLRGGDGLRLQDELLHSLRHEQLEQQDAAIALFRLALVYDATGIYCSNNPSGESGALEYLAAALRIFEKEGAELWIARTQLQMGAVLLKLGFLTESSTRLESSFGLFSKLGDQEGIAGAHLQIGYSLYIQARNSQDLANVRGHYSNAYNIYRSLGDSIGSIKTALQMVEFQILLGNYEEALSLCRKTIKQAEETGDKRQIARNLLLQSFATFFIGRETDESRERAYQLATQALAIFNEMRDNPGIANSLYHAGMILLENGEFSPAEGNLNQAYELRMRTGDVRGLSASCLGYGDYYKKMGDNAQALQWYREAIEYATTINSHLSGVAEKRIRELSN